MIKHAKKKGNETFQMTDKLFDKFVDECKYWVEFYKLYDYSIQYVMRKNSTLRGWCSSGNLFDRMIEIGIAKTWTEPITDWQLCYVAFHEVTECLTMRYFLLALDREARADDFREENHTIIHRLQYAIFKPYFDGKGKK